MADGILGLGSSGSTSLNSELIEKLRTADEKANLEPITEAKEAKQAEIDGTEEIYTKLKEFLETLEQFDLFNNDDNIFDSVSGATSGSGVSFDSTDTSGLNPGRINVVVSQLATKSIYQGSSTISSKDTTFDSTSDPFTFSVNGTDYSYDTAGKTYEEVVSSINTNANVEASLEEVGDGEYRVVLKSADTGTANAITNITSGNSLGIDTTALQDADNLIANIDGVNYDVSSNQITLGNGLIITATDVNGTITTESDGTTTTTGGSAITLTRDTSGIADAIEDIATKYNELIEVYDKYTQYDEDEETTVIKQSGTLDGIMNTIKNAFYQSYGLDENDPESAIALGFSFNSDGEMEVDSSVLGEALTNDFDSVKDVFTGYAEKKGIGTYLSEYIDGLDTETIGELTKYMKTLSDKLKELTTEETEETEKLDKKYSNMAQRFAEYTAMITKMENSFSSLKQIINSDSSDD